MCVASFSRDDVRRVLIWAKLGYLLPEQQWDHDRDGAWRGYKGRSSYCESIRHTPKNHPHDPAPNVTGLGMFMAQPANALSNYCFVVYGFVLAALFCGDVLRRTRRTSVTAAVVPDAGHEAAKAADREAAEAATVATMAAASSLTVHPRNNIFFFPLWTLALAICLALLGITSDQPGMCGMLRTSSGNKRTQCARNIDFESCIRIRSVCVSNGNSCISNRSLKVPS